MRKPSDYDNVQAYEERRKLPAGGYVCEIKKAKETKSSTGKDMIEFAIDICEGEYRGFFFDEFTRAQSFQSDVKWPYDGTCRQLVLDSSGKTSKFFKGLCTAIEAENVVIDWTDRFCDSIKGAKIGVVFGEEEIESKRTGNTYWTTKPKFYCTCEDIRTGHYRTPEPKPLEKPINTLAWAANAGPADSFAAAEEDIPF